MRNLIIYLIITALFTGCKESPEQAAQRIRDTMVAMQELSQEEQQAHSQATFDRLAKHGEAISKGMTFSNVNEMLGEPLQVRVNDGAISQAWSGTKDGKTITLAVRFEKGIAADVMMDRKP